MTKIPNNYFMSYMHLDKQTENKIHLKQLLIGKLNKLALKPTQNHPLEEKYSSPLEVDEKLVKQRSLLTENSECEHTHMYTEKY